MSGAEIRITHNAADFQRDMEAAQAKVANVPRRAWPRVIIEVDKWIQQNFKTEGKLAEAGGWTPLSSAAILGRLYYPAGRGKLRNRATLDKYWATPKSQRDQFLDGLRGKFRILQREGKLKNTWIHRITDDKAEVVSTVRDNYGLIHDEGGKKIPRRQIVPEDKQIWPLIEPLINKVLGDAIRGT